MEQKEIMNNDSVAAAPAAPKKAKKPTMQDEADQLFDLQMRMASKTKGSDRLGIALFCALLAAFGSLILILPDKDFSEQENRKLQKFPQLQSRFDGSLIERIKAGKLFEKTIPAFEGDKAAFIECIRKALYASKIISYAQGYSLMRSAAKTYGWNLNYGGIALMWRGGCIIRSVFLGKIKEAYDKNGELENLLMDDYFAETIKGLVPAWREVVAYAVKAGISMPAFSSALSYFDGYRCEKLPANLLQAQRDYFGAHTYERIDCERGKFFHTNWTGEGGNTTSQAYQA